LHSPSQELKNDLEKSQPRVMSLKETADQLLVNTDSAIATESKEKLHMVAGRLNTLLKICQLYLAQLQQALGMAEVRKTMAEIDRSVLDVFGNLCLADDVWNGHQWRVLVMQE
jgi:hypothetical protein